MSPFAAVVALLVSASPFPLPAVDGKPLAVTQEQKRFRLPMRFEKVKAFYEAELGKQKDVALKVAGSGGARTLTLSSKKKGDTWAKAVVTEGELETVVDVTPVLTLDTVEVNGTGTPLVQFVIGRSKEVDKAVQETQDPLMK